jgi:hypothetical protein
MAALRLWGVYCALEMLEMLEVPLELGGVE